MAKWKSVLAWPNGKVYAFEKAMAVPVALANRGSLAV